MHPPVRCELPMDDPGCWPRWPCRPSALSHAHELVHPKHRPVAILFLRQFRTNPSRRNRAYQYRQRLSDPSGLGHPLRATRPASRDRGGPCPGPASLLSLNPITSYPPTHIFPRTQKNCIQTGKILRKASTFGQSHTLYTHRQGSSSELLPQDVTDLEHRRHPLPPRGAKPGDHLGRCSFSCHKRKIVRKESPSRRCLTRTPGGN